MTDGLFYQRGLPLLPARRSTHMPSKVCDGITCSFPNFNGTTVEGAPGNAVW